MVDIKTDIDGQREQTDAGRRSFMWKVGAGISAVLAASVPAVAKPLIGNDKKMKTNVESLSKQVAVLEDEKAISSINRSYGDFLDKGMYREALGLFSDNAEVVFNGGVFKGKNRGLKRLFCDHFKSGLTGKRIDPAPGFELNQEQQQEMLNVASDQKSAKARLSYSIQVGVPIESDSLLVKMARLQGEGIQRWWEGGVYELSYVKSVRDGWKIKRLEYRTLSKANYKPGRSYATPISVPGFSKIYPADPAGPDRLV